MQAIFQPSAHSVALRARVADVIAQNRRVRPRVPFWQLAAHRIPTLWSLYRGLLRHAPSDDIRFRITVLFRKHRQLTSPATTRQQLAKGHKWLDIFQRAHAGEQKLQTILARYSRMIASRREKEHWKTLVRNEVAHLAYLARRPILTGGLMKATIYNRPLPRMKRQPLGLSMMIAWRRRARARRVEQYSEMNDSLDDLRAERSFEEALTRTGARVQTVFAGVQNEGQWMELIRSKQRTIRETYKLDIARAQTPFTVPTLVKIRAARRERIANHTRELQRERHGEVTNRALRRRRSAPPAHVLGIMTEKQRRMDRAARSVSEVGFAALARTKLGHKLKNPKMAREVEEGKAGNQKWLEDMTRGIEDENRSRRMKVKQQDGVNVS